MSKMSPSTKADKVNGRSSAVSFMTSSPNIFVDFYGTTLGEIEVTFFAVTVVLLKTAEVPSCVQGISS